MHPSGGREVGWDEVRFVWEQVAPIFADGRVTVDDLLVRVGGDLAYTTGFERGEGIVAGEPVRFDHRVTNIYRRENGGWKRVHHHTDVSPELAEIVRRLREAQVAANSPRS